MKVGNREVNGRAYVSNFNFKGSTQQKPVDLLSGGERNHVLLAKMLKEPWKVILLHEPTHDPHVDHLLPLEEALEPLAGRALVLRPDQSVLQNGRESFGER